MFLPVLALHCLLMSIRYELVNSVFVYYQNYEYLSTVKLNDYAGYYGNVRLMRYTMPEDVLSAIWRLQLVATESCAPTDFYFYLEYAAYPVISPHNRSFPMHFSSERLTKTFVRHTLGGGSGGSGRPLNLKQDVYLNVSSPNAGYWFSAAFVDTSGGGDASGQSIKPDLLKANCSFFLTASVNLWQMNDTLAVQTNRTVRSTSHDIFKIYKYMSLSHASPPFVFDIRPDRTTTTDNSNSNSNSNSNCSIVALMRQSAFPDMITFANNAAFKRCTSTSNGSSSARDSCTLSALYPLKDTWYYLAVTSDCNYTLDVYASAPSVTTLSGVCSSSNNSSSSSNNCSGIVASPASIPAPIETFRFIGPTYFAVKYYFNSNYNRSNALLVRADQTPYFIEFLVDLANSGGTLHFYMITNLIYDLFAAESAQSSSTTSTSNPQLNYTTTGASNNNNNNYTYNNAGNLSYDEQFEAAMRSSSNNMNNMNAWTNNNNNNGTRLNAAVDEVKVMLRACLLYNSMATYRECPPGYEVATQSHGSLFTNMQLNVAYPQIGKWYLAIWKECTNSKNEIVACPVHYVPYTVIQISSDQCANDYCGEFGTCYIVNSQLNMFSACKCTAGYEGYGCTDARNAISARTYLISVLMLTTSNLIFLLPICLALYRRWYIESLIYFYNMFFSTFYHACDQEFYSFCIFNYDGLQLADFISSYTSFVVTILSMSTIVRPWKVFTFFVGMLACLTINLYDRFSYIGFIVFLCIAISVTVSTWVKICLSKRRLHPSMRTLTRFYLPGFVLAITGLLIYSYFQTKSNYWVLHSLWHICMASSILFFLPKRDRSDQLVLEQRSKSTDGDHLKDVTTTSLSLSESSGGSASGSSSGSGSPSTKSSSEDTSNNLTINTNSHSHRNHADSIDKSCLLLHANPTEITLVNHDL